MRMVSKEHLTPGKIGGGAWAELKFDENKFPTWQQLQGASLWRCPELYKSSVWSWLCSDNNPWAKATAATLNTQDGSLCTVTVEVGDREEKLLLGPVGAILSSRTEANLVVAELGVHGNFWSEELAATISHCSNQRGGVRLALWGTTESVEAAVKGPVTDLIAADGLLPGYKSRIITVHLPQDDPLPYRISWSTSVVRHVLLLSPDMFSSGPDYITSLIGWCPAVINQLVHLLNVHRTIFSLPYCFMLAKDQQNRKSLHRIDVKKMTPSHIIKYLWCHTYKDCPVLEVSVHSASSSVPAASWA